MAAILAGNNVEEEYLWSCTLTGSNKEYTWEPSSLEPERKEEEQESYPYIGVSWHKSGSKIRLREDDFKIVDDDGNVILVLTNVEDNHTFTCTIINEIAENLTSCKVIVNSPEAPLVQLDEDVIR